ncbi:biotin--[acetyl-CoA-carboxylase] ligase [Alkalicoccus halolimnae]|uniref:Bifunctional ligase/repressor BirA n=1 Tax=Alkalicoccus halolimnae TaxID=1667239 RepID=A0A5C7F0P5_9BACI|nr:biotin--[acetyl-CoA-carboxylase] ligase [Alkalicoccus halolimnae]TXF82980.1 biotin--[acetyl-CoA-carboxylase] ligase [Alkalicoccus halolimnae]
MKSELLAVLNEAYPEYVSGEKLSILLHCSRTAVWKHIKNLQEEGYQIKAVRNKGYLLESSPSLYSGHAVASRLIKGNLPYQIRFYPELLSTQNEAQRLAMEGAEEGTVVIADKQTKGRGRLGREWESSMGTGLAVSLILKPDVPAYKAPQLTLVAAVSVVKAIEQITGVKAEIKWPNDLLIEGKKVCGILTEMQADPDRIKSVIVGIGLNVNETVFPEHLHHIAASLSGFADSPPERAQLAAAVLNQFAEDYELYKQSGFAGVKAEWESYSCTLGRKIQVRQNGSYINGTAEAVDSQGVLKLRDKDGILHSIVSGDIEIS